MKLVSNDEARALHAVSKLPVDPGAWAAAVAARESQWQPLEPRANGATGVWQITPGVIADYVKATGNAVALTEMRDPEKALPVWLWYWDALRKNPKLPMMPEWAVFAYVVGPGRLASELRKNPLDRQTVVAPWTWQQAVKPSGMVGSRAKMSYVREVSGNARAVLEGAKVSPFLWFAPAPLTAAMLPVSARAVWRITRPRPGLYHHAFPHEINALAAISKKLVPESPWVPDDNWVDSWVKWATTNAATIKSSASELTLKHSGIPFAKFVPAAAETAQQALTNIKKAEESIWDGFLEGVEWVEAGLGALLLYVVWRATQ